MSLRGRGNLITAGTHRCHSPIETSPPFHTAPFALWNISSCSIQILRLLESSLYSFPGNNKRQAQDRPRTILLIYPNTSISGPISSLLLQRSPPMLTNVLQSNIEPKKTKRFGAATEVFPSWSIYLEKKVISQATIIFWEGTRMVAKPCHPALGVRGEG